MKPSPLRHPVAVLRQILGLGQKDLADLVGRSQRTIQSVELGTLPLSEKLAYDIAEQTGINVAWLLTGDAKATPVNLDYKVYSKSDFEAVQAKGLVPQTELFRSDVPVHFTTLSRAVMIVMPLMMAVAAALEKRQSGIAIYRVHKLIRSLSEEIGWTSEELLQYAQHSKFWLSDPLSALNQGFGGALFDDPRGKPIFMFDIKPMNLNQMKRSIDASGAEVPAKTPKSKTRKRRGGGASSNP